MKLIFVRHGESEANAGLSALEDSPLTPLGVEQATRSAGALQSLRVAALYCSPKERALQTATILAGPLSLSPQVWPDLSEFCVAGRGLSRSHILTHYPGVKLPPEVDEQGWARRLAGETPDEIVERMKRVADRIREWAKNETYSLVACVIHGTTGNVLLRHLFSVHPEANLRFSHRHCGITRLELEAGGRCRVTALNDLRHLDGVPDRSPMGDVALDAGYQARSHAIKSRIG